MEKLQSIEPYKEPLIMHSLQYYPILREFEDKISKDQIILKANPSLENKIIYTRNLLFYHQMHVIATEVNSDIAKESLEHQKDGWFIWLQVFSFTPGIPFKTKDEEFTYFFDKYFDKTLSEIDGNNYYNECVSNYKCGNYYSCVCGLFPLIENIEKEIAKFDGKKIFRIKEALNNTHTPEGQRKEYFEKFEKNMNSFLKDYIYKVSTESDEEPKVISRNRILHGIFTRKINKTDCLKLMCIYKSMYCFNAWLKSLTMIKNLTEELKKLEEQKNAQE